MPRRKSIKPSKTVSKKDDSFDEELAIQIYGQKDYEAPENKGLETVIEVKNENEVENNTNSRSRNRIGKASGFQPQLRMMTRTGQHYLYDDREKEILRKKQVNKLFKGRKKMKWKGLSAKQEVNLIEMIANKSETEDSESEEENTIIENQHQIPYIMDGTETSILSAADLTLRLSESSQSSDNSPSFHTPMKGNVSTDTVTFNIKTGNISRKSDSFSDVFHLANDSLVGQSIELTTPMTPDLTNAKETIENKEEIANELKEADDLFGPLEFIDVTSTKSKERKKNNPKRSKTTSPAATSILTSMNKPVGLTDSVMKKKINELKEVDDFLGPIGFSDDECEDHEFSFKTKKLAQNNKENAMVSGVRRQSNIAKVRRSSRFLTPLADQNSSTLGSVITEVEIKDRRKSRRSNFFQRPHLDLNETRSSSSEQLNEEALKLIKHDVHISSI